MNKALAPGKRFHPLDPSTVVPPSCDRRKTRREEWPLNQRLYSNVMVVKFFEHEQLVQGWIPYIFKTINFWEPIYEVYLRPENLEPDGKLHPAVDRLLLEEIPFMHGWIDETFSCKGLTLSKTDGTRRLNWSFLWGCLRFGDGEQFIRYETEKERKRRHERAERQRERREAKRERDFLAKRLAEREGL